MGLPRTREITLDSSTPLPASLGNLQQDMTIGRKHGPVPFILAASSFHKYTGAATLVAGPWVGVGIFISPPLHFNPGAVIDELKWIHNRGGAGTMSLSVIETTPGPPFSTKSMGFTINAGGVAAATTYDTAAMIAAGLGTVCTPTLSAESGWVIQVEHDNAANEFHGLRMLLAQI